MANRTSTTPLRSARAAVAGIALLLAAGMTAMPSRAQAPAPDQQAVWSIRLGGGVGVVPRYPGSREFRASPVPDVDITYRNLVFLNMNGLGVYVIRDRTLTLGGSIWMRGGRSESDTDRLRGLGDIDTAAQARIFGRVAVGPVQLGATLARDLGGSDGFTVDLNLSAMFQPLERLRIMPGIGVTIGDNRYVGTWFGVSRDQSLRSGLPQFDARAGITSAAGLVRASYMLTEHWSLNAMIGVQRLLGDAADSPITERRTLPMAAFTVSYRF